MVKCARTLIYITIMLYTTVGPIVNTVIVSMLGHLKSFLPSSTEGFKLFAIYF